MGYDQKEKVQMKLEFLRMLIKLQLDPAREHLIASIFEKYHNFDTERGRGVRGSNQTNSER